MVALHRRSTGTHPRLRPPAPAGGAAARSSLGGMATRKPRPTEHTRKRATAASGRERLGRVNEIHTVIDQRDGGEVQVTRLDRIIETFRVGGTIADAAARAGVARQCLYDWQRKGVRVRAELIAGTKRDAELTADDLDYLAYVEAVEKAESEGKLLLLGLNDRLARGGIPLTTTTVKTDATGNVVERTEKTEHTLPDGAAIRWALQCRWPDEFQPRQKVELAGQVAIEGQPADRAADLAESLRAYLDGIEDATTSQPTPDAAH